jgi:hypothetical protein
MVPKRGHGGSKKVAHGFNCAEEWVRSISNEVALNALVVHGVLPDRTTAGWRPAFDEEFPMAHTDELVVFKDYFFCGFGIPIHPFLHGLIGYYGVSLCNLSPNSVLHVTIFINFYESYLRMLPYFDLFHHFSVSKSEGIRI